LGTKKRANSFRLKCVLVLTIACIDHKLLTKNWKILTAIQSIPSRWECSVWAQKQTLHNARTYGDKFYRKYCEFL
jgi:hypothetical protein